jgi:hypothetical protein
VSQEWTLESELKTLTNTDSVADALVALGLLGNPSDRFDIVVLSDWYMSGSETYLMHFHVGANDLSRRFVIKACTAYSPAQSLTAIFDEWLARRRCLEKFSVSTPSIIATGSALLIEEYIPFTLREAFDHTKARANLARCLGWTAGRVAAAGFMPLSVHDWRSRGSDIVLIDFGQDLGPARPSVVPDITLLPEVLDHLDRLHINLNSSEISYISEGYETALNHK